MKIITRAKGIPAYTIKKGILRIEPDEKEAKIWLKLDVGKEQYIVELDRFELARVIACAIYIDEIIATCERDGLIKKEEIKKLKQRWEV